MLYDLSILWTPTSSAAELQKIVSFSSELGYDTLALNHIIPAPIPAQIINPIPQTLPFSLLPKTTILRRCTVHFQDPSYNHRLPALSSAYDILALRPSNEKAFLAACTSVQDYSLISLDLTQRFAFHFRPSPIMAAVRRGIRFEICYVQAILGDSTARRNFVSNCMGLFRATSGRGLILSSGAKVAMGLRAPADVINLMNVWGLGRERAVEAMSNVPRSVVINEGLRRTSFRGVIDVIEGGKTSNFPSNNKGKVVEPNKKGSGQPSKGKRGREGSFGEGQPQTAKRTKSNMRIASYGTDGE